MLSIILDELNRMSGGAVPDYVTRTDLVQWVSEMAALCSPDRIHWCDGSLEESDSLCDQMVESGTFIRLNPELRPGSFLARSDPSDVASSHERSSAASESRRPGLPITGSIRAR